MDSALSEALAPVLRDLENSGAPLPDVRDRQWSDVPGQVTAMLYGPDGSGQGVSAMAGEPLPDRIASVADQVQEWAVEALWHAGRPATWPECPEHPGSHPLAARLRDHRAAWTCPKTGNLICAVGELTGPGTRSRRRRLTKECFTTRPGRPHATHRPTNPVSAVDWRSAVDSGCWDTGDKA